MKNIKKLLSKNYLLNIDPIYSISIVGTSYLILYAFIHFARKEVLIATIETSLVVLSFLNLLIYKILKNKEFASNAILFTMILFFDYLLIDGGVEKTGIFWIYFYPTLAFFLKDKLYGIYWNIAFIISVIILLLLEKENVIDLAYKDDIVVLSLVTYSSIFIVMVFIKSNINFNYEQIEKLATTDSLTGIFNRFQIMKLLNMELERAKRYNKVFSVIIFDIDNFKKINDTYGHQKGDMVLQKVASLLKENLRQTDFFGRLGGEEFIVIAPETKAEDAFKLAEKLRKLLENANFDSVGQVTASFGISQYEKGKDVNQLLKEADEALYIAKRKGKNLVCIFGKCEKEAPAQGA